MFSQDAEEELKWQKNKQGGRRQSYIFNFEILDMEQLWVTLVLKCDCGREKLKK